MNIVCYNVLYDMCYNENSQRFLVQWEMGILSDIGPVKLSDIISVEIMLKKILSTVIFKELLFSVRLYKEKTQTGEESLETHELGVLLIFWKINIASTQNESCFLFFDCLVNRGFKIITIEIIQGHVRVPANTFNNHISLLKISYLNESTFQVSAFVNYKISSWFTS